MERKWKFQHKKEKFRRDRKTSEKKNLYVFHTCALKNILYLYDNQQMHIHKYVIEHMYKCELFGNHISIKYNYVYVAATVGTGSFPGVKRLRRGADHPPPSKCRGHERVRLYLYSPSEPQWSDIGRTFTQPLCTIQCIYNGQNKNRLLHSLYLKGAN